MRGVTTETVSIIVLCHGRWARTRRCLEALRRCTPTGLYELLVYDNASTDRTHERLRRLSRGWPQLKVRRNERNLPFARAVNRGMDEARGRWVVWLNNDTVPSPGWLEALLATARLDDAVAAVGPMTGVMAPPEQLAAPFANDKLTRAHEATFLGGFCLLLRREAVRAVGRLDERFVWGWEDIDYCLRLRQAGWRLARASHVFVEHAGGATMEGMASPLRRTTDLRNRRLLETKWASCEGEALRLADLFSKCPAPWDASRHPLVSILMPCAGEWPAVRAGLSSLRRHAPRLPYEVLVADTGRGGRLLAGLEELEREWPELLLLGRWDGAPYPDAMNRLLRAARGRDLVMLVQGARLSARWCEVLANAAASASNVGLVAPRSSGAVSPWQKRGRAGAGTVPAGYLGGSCLFLPRRVFEKTGLLDDRFTGGAAHTDYSLRVLQSGQQLLVARGAFIPSSPAQPSRRETADARLLFQKWAGSPLFAAGAR